MLEEPIYDLNELVRSNWHVHTHHSACSSQAMTLPCILAMAQASGVHTIALTDHHHHEKDTIEEKILALQQDMEGRDSSVTLHFGAELTALDIGIYSDSLELNQKIPYRLYACNHFQMSSVFHPVEESPRAYAEHSLEVLRALLPTGRADCIAHPLVGVYLSKILPDHTAVGACITDAELGDILELGRVHNVAWDFNTKVARHDPKFMQRLWHTGKELGVIFHLGTDAHAPNQIDPRKDLDFLEKLLLS